MVSTLPLRIKMVVDRDAAVSVVSGLKVGDAADRNTDSSTHWNSNNSNNCNHAGRTVLSVTGFIIMVLYKNVVKSLNVKVSIV